MDNIFEQMTQITRAAAYPILVEQVQELKEENEKLKKEIEVMRHSYNSVCELSVEFGYKQCEKGENIQTAINNYKNIKNDLK